MKFCINYTFFSCQKWTILGDITFYITEVLFKKNEKWCTGDADVTSFNKLMLNKNCERPNSVELNVQVKKAEPL